MIHGVVARELITHPDERGYFREVIRVDDEFFREGFAQWNHTLMHAGVAKAWHVHARQVDWWYVAAGVLKVALYDTRHDSPTRGELMELFLGDGHPARVLRIPPGVAHGCKCLSAPTHLLYITSKTYDSSDEGRIAHDNPEIGYDWLGGPEVK